MFTRKALPLTTILVIVLLALATMGLAYGHWIDVLHVDGTVNTGTFDADFLSTFTDDGAHEDNINYDLGDVDCALDPLCIFGAGARDPMEGGPNPDRYDKAVGSCASGITTDGKLWFQLSNVYPSYHCTVWASIYNPGSIPWKIAGEKYYYDDTALELEWVDAPPLVDKLSCGDQIDPNIEGGTLVGLTIHVKQEATQQTTYNGWYEVEVVNWNEFDSDMCTSEFVPPTSP